MDQKQHDHAGQPEKIDDARVQLLIGAFQNGLDVKAACIYAGISRETFYKKKREDEKFSDIIERARNNLTEIAGNRIAMILRTGDDKVAAPLAWKIFERKMPEEYGPKQLTPAGGNQTQNNFFLIDNAKLRDTTKAYGIDDSDPTQLLKDVKTASDLVNRTEERRIVDVHSDLLQSEDSTPSGLS